MERSRDINVMGEVTSITYPAHGASAYLDVMISLYDGDEYESEGTESLLLRFLGRHTMACLEIGSTVRVNGTLSHVAAMPVVFNPAITVLAGQ